MQSTSGTIPEEQGVSGEQSFDEPPGGQLAASPRAVQDGPAAVTPFAAGDATIRVRKAGDRLGNASTLGATGLAGAVFEAYAKGASQTKSFSGLPVAATCTSGAAGNCDLKVDAAKGPRYVVVERSAPTGWRKIDQIALGEYNASGTPRDYRWNVGVQAGQTTIVPETEIRNVTGQESWDKRPASPSNPAYQWADARDNPPLPPSRCGLNVAMLFDQSGSIGSNLPLVKNAAKQFIDDLTGTPTSIALFTFSTDSPQNPTGSQNRPDLVSLADPTGAAQVKGYIDGFGAANGGTNWDAGLRRVANASQQYDVLIVLTDGNPTAWEGEKKSTGDVDDYDVENAVHSANWVKSKGTRIVAVGFSGESGGLNSLNLTTISGTLQNDDYYLTTFGDLDDVLSSIALNGCGGTINVQKRIAPTWPAAESVPQEPNWPFRVAPDQRYVTPPSGTTGPNGEPLTFKVTFNKAQLARDVTISEPDNHNDTVLVQDAGKNARCFLQGQRPLPADRIVNAGPFGFTVKDVTDKEIISCLVVDSAAQLQAVKYNDTNGNGGRDASEPGLPGWTVFLDANGNSTLDPGETSASTNAQGEVLFDRLEAPAEYRVCEVLQSGWFNTDPGGGAVCKTQQVNLGDAPAGPVLFGNIQAGGFTITKDVVDDSGFVPPGTTYSVEVRCTQGGAPVPGFNPRTFTLTDGQTVTVGPLAFATTCTIAEVPAPTGVGVTVEPSTVTIGDGGAAAVKVTNTYPVGYGEVVKVVDGPLAGALAPAGTPFGVDVSCTFPAGYPVQGAIPGYDPKPITVESGPVGQPGPAVPFGPLPVGSRCTAVETDENGADPFGVTPDSVTIAAGTERVRFTASNTYRPAALRINKVVEGPGAAFVPRDTVYVADVVCTFLGVTTFDGEVEFGVDDPGIVSGQPIEFPVGTVCTVTEADSQGATWAPQTQTVELIGPDPVLVDVTITNTFEAGELTVTKAVDDGGTGLVPDGTRYTIEADCTFSGNPLPGYPQDVVLTTPDDLTKTLTGLPYGTECTVSEPNPNGAGSVAYEPSDTVTVDEQTPAVEVTVTNTYPVGTFPVRKAVTGGGGQFVPGGTAYTVEVRCTFPDGFPASGPIPGYDPLEVTLNAPGSADQTTEVIGPLPVGSVCAVTETDQAGAGSVTVQPAEITVSEGDQNVEVVVTNTYPVGTFPVTKVVAGLGANFVPVDTEFTIDVACEYPAGFPSSGPIPGFDPRTVVLKAPTFGPDRTAAIGPLPVGSQCTVTERDQAGAGSVTIMPGSVTVAEGDQNVEVKVTNTYPVGYGEIVKVATGPLVGQLAPEGTVFLVEVSCTFPTGFPTQGDVPGFSPLELAIESGPPGQPGIPTEFGPLPVGSTCAVVETETNGADPVEVVPPAVTILDPASTPGPVQVTVTNTFNPAALRITKVVTGPGAALLPTDTVFTAQVECTFQGQTTFDGEVEVSVDNPGEVTDQPIGASCEITETETNGATAVSISPNPAILTGPSPVLVDATVTNTMPAGQLTVAKEIDGEAAGVVPDGVSFTVGVNCSFQGTPLPGYPVELTFTTPSQLSETLTGLPVGAACFVNESDDGGATSVEFVPPAGPNDPAGQSGTVTVTASAQEPVTVSVRNIFEPAVLLIFKEVQPEGVLLPPGLLFTAQVDCTFDGESIYSGEVEFGVESPGVASGLIVGSECTVTETESQGATFEPASQTVVLEGDDPVTVDVTITNTFPAGSLSVQKVVDDGGTGLVPPDTLYDIEVACQLDGTDLPGYPTTVTVVPSDGLVDLPGPLPVGTTCDLAEPELNGASAVTFTPTSPVEITEDNPDVEVTATNTYPVGTFPVRKVLDGPGASLVPPGTQFTVEVRCTFPAGFPATGPVPGFDPKTVTLTGGQTVPVGPVPVGSECTIAETDRAGAGSSTVVPGTVTVAEGDQDVEVVVTNTFGAPPPKPPTKPPAKPPVPPEVPKTGADGLGPMLWGSAALVIVGGALLGLSRRRRV